MKTIVNIETGEIIERELNKEELAQNAKDLYASEAKQAEAEAKAVAKAAAESKLAALGLTTDDLRALGL